MKRARRHTLAVAAIAGATSMSTAPAAADATLQPRSETAADSGVPAAGPSATGAMAEPGALAGTESGGGAAPAPKTQAASEPRVGPPGEECPRPARPVAEIDGRVEAAVGRGRARVIVELRLPGGVAPEGELGSAARVDAQRRAIAAAQATVLSRLAGTDFTLVRRFGSVPLLTLEIGASALAGLRAMGDVVARVMPEAVIPPAPPPGAGH